LTGFSASLIFWFKQNGRDLPWRQTSDPYHVWLSEVILQQTRVAQGLAYYRRFLERFPTVKDLALAEQDQVLEIWQGLGYYSRARNLHSAAKYVFEQLGNVFPQTYVELLKLKGVGTYTAAAISSFAFHEDQVVVDGNVLRLYARLFRIREDIRSVQTQNKIYDLVKGDLPAGDSWNFNQAIMELGALVCLPQKPVCLQCPVSVHCLAFKAGSQTEIPFKSKAKARRTRFMNYLLLEYDGSLYFQKRESKDIWEGLYEPILFEKDFLFTSLNQFEEEYSGPLDVAEVQPYPVTKHILSHQELIVGLWKLVLRTKPDRISGLWVPASNLHSLPKPIIFSKILGLKNGTTLPLIF